MESSYNNVVERCHNHFQREQRRQEQPHYMEVFFNRAKSRTKTERKTSGINSAARYCSYKDRRMN